MWKNLKGMKFGHLTVIKRVDDYVYPSSGKHEPRWLCECDCEDHNLVTAIQHNLLNGHTTNCGCDKDHSKGKLIDMIGKKFNHLTVIKRVDDRIDDTGKHFVQYECECDCEEHTHVIVDGHNLRNGHVKSCGHLQIESSTKHGLHGTRIYNILSGMKRRCYNKNDVAYPGYGGRGIYICDEWLDPENGVVNFYNWAIDNGYSDELTIDRIDNDGPYSPDNCRWTTAKIQANNRSNTTAIEFNGETHTLTEWSEITGMSIQAINVRLNLGWSIEDTLTIPIDSYILSVSDSSGETHTLTEWAEIKGLSRNLLYDRIFRDNWEVDRALNTPVNKITKEITFQGDTYSYSDWERARGYSSNTISHRLRRGWTENEALNGKPGTQPMNAIFYVDDNGKPISEEEYNRTHPDK